MKKLLFINVAFLVLLNACVSNEIIPTKSNVVTVQPKSLSASQQGSTAPVKKDDIQNEIAQCIQVVNSSNTAKSVDGTIFALDPANPSSKFLYSSPNKLTTDEATLLAKFKRETQKCRQITNKIQSPELRKVYQGYFSKIDRVYDDLIYKKITIGVANQERSLLMNQFKVQFLDALNQ